jgi:hypothetical protein
VIKLEFKPEVYGRRKGYGFRIIREDGVVVMDQDVKPCVEGFQPMTKTEAERIGEKTAEEYKVQYEKLEENE